jgi:hypothetical protein
VVTKEEQEPGSSDILSWVVRCFVLHSKDHQGIFKRKNSILMEEKFKTTAGTP